uniref:Retrotransposon protein, putative, Ty3-gypsy subclass n=1 Tax=Oryza sativa subsp. japonica TaxID=39947 RepID=Q10HS4_ORYSJ|nr:retrotransposon protein, putative, Ty3-gypsy subclass [Oryza sativa Japonica Group]
MGFISGIDNFVFPPEKAFRFGSFDFITNDFGKISLLDSDSNQSGRGQISTPFGIPNSAEIYPKIISTELASNHSGEIQSTPTRSDQDDGAYPPILMKLPDDLAAVFTTRASSPRRSRRDPASAPIQPSSREVGVILQPLGTVSTEQLDGYLSSPDIDSRPTEIIEYDDFGYRYDCRNLDDFDEDFEDNYTPLYFGIFMADNETEEQRKAQEAEEQRVQQEAERRRLEEERQAQERERLQHRYDDDVDGVAAFTSDLRRVDWPAGFKPTGIEKYDGTTNPESRLTVYGLTIRAAGGDSKAMANYLHVALADSARSWLHGLPRGTIGSWAELRDHFIANFQGTFERPGTQFDLYNFAEQYAKNARKTSDGDQSTSKKKDDEDDAPTSFQDHHKELNHIFGGPLAYESKRKQKLTEREINVVQPNTPQYLRWSETTIKFDRSDHPNRVVHPGRYPLIPRMELKPSNAPFHGVIPGLSATPLGQITLPVTFGTQENFRTENICFEVADFDTAYHAILGRPAIAKFMAVPHYTYMMMKMPGPRGVISLRSDIKQAVTCDKESCEMA